MVDRIDGVLNTFTSSTPELVFLRQSARTRSHLGQPDCGSVAAEAVRLLQHYQIHAEGCRLLQEGEVRPFF
jgi:hypothetical protein